MKIKFHKFVRRVNVVHIVCDNVLGTDHSHRHRMIAGSVLMSVGVFISKCFGHVEFEIVHYITDGVGYLIHGIGCVPFVDWVMDKANETQKEIKTIAEAAEVFEDTH